MIPGICTKCGKEGMVQNHHWHGYGEEHKDDVALYCQSCDQKAHNKAKKEGKCTLSSDESHKKSRSSYNRRNYIKYTLSEQTLSTNIALRERIRYNKNIDSIAYECEFTGYHGNKLYYINA